jgi:predicted regulator of Ras-like GTPase activity (Roadblock/LC7/MglB family)
MPTLPQLVEEDISVFDAQLQELLDKSDASTALLIDQGGFLLTSRGKTGDLDATTLAALASGAYLANQTIANLIQETNFSAVYQQGEKQSMLIVAPDSQCLLVIVFQAQVSAGLVKYYAGPAAQIIAAQMKKAAERAPGEGLDLSVLNLADASDVFKRKAEG